MERLITLLENVTVLIEQYMDLQIALLLIGGFVALLFGIVILKSAQTKKLKRQLSEAENRFNEIKSTPLLFKLNKAVALARVNENVNQAIDACKGDFEHVQENLKLCSAMLGDIDDLIFVHKRKAARRAYTELHELLHELEVSARNVNMALDEVLQQENIQREQINVQKEEYRRLKKAFQKDAVQYNDAYATIEGRLANIETQFSSFEEWMFASEFNKASEQQRAIIDELAMLQKLYDHLPPLFEKAKGVLPALLENTSFEYLNARNKGVRLDQYDISEQLELVTSLLQEDLSKLRNCEIKGVKDHLEDAEVRLNQINDAIHKENRLYEEVHNNIDGMDADIQTLLLQIEKLKTTYARVSERFGFENWEVRLVDLDSNMEDLRNNRNTINELILESKTPYNRIHAHFSEVELQLRQLEKEVSTMLEQLESACADESRAKKQLVKLQVILNDIKISIHKQHLPSVSIKYQEDLQYANLYVQDVIDALERVPLEVSDLNDKVKIAIDYVYKLYNNVNNLVGVAALVEETITLGNRYRSTLPDVDSQLTRAELCFRNGEYTKALKIAVATIEKIHPGAYEKILAKAPASA